MTKNIKESQGNIRHTVHLPATIALSWCNMQNIIKLKHLQVERVKGNVYLTIICSPFLFYYTSKELMLLPFFSIIRLVNCEKSKINRVNCVSMIIKLWQYSTYYVLKHINLLPHNLSMLYSYRSKMMSETWEEVKGWEWREQIASI